MFISLTSSFSSTIVKVTEGIKNPPKFDGLNFSIWKVKMTVFLQSVGSRVAKVVTKPFSVPAGDEDTWSDIATKDFDANAKAHYALLQALNDEQIRLRHLVTLSGHSRGNITSQ